MAPSLSVSPSTTNVPNGDTVTINIQSSVTVGVLSSISCQFNGGALPANVSFTATGGGGLLDLGGSVNATLTITNVSSASAGTYTFSASTVGLLGGLLTSTATSTVSVPPIVKAVTVNSQMQAKGFKIQFSAPTGSNLVIQASSDMKNWTSVYTNVVTGGSLSYTDPVAKTLSYRYYRAKLK
ncbi:MAG TPA: immunoglobulin domain-containing protein [Verrucomicrobiae bacterium]